MVVHLNQSGFASNLVESFFKTPVIQLLRLHHIALVSPLIWLILPPMMMILLPSYKALQPTKVILAAFAGFQAPLVQILWPFTPALLCTATNLLLGTWRQLFTLFTTYTPHMTMVPPSPQTPYLQCTVTSIFHHQLTSKYMQMQSPLQHHIHPLCLLTVIHAFCSPIQNAVANGTLLPQFKFRSMSGGIPQLFIFQRILLLNLFSVTCCLSAAKSIYGHCWMISRH